MARWGKIDYRQFKKLRDRMEKLEQSDLDAFCTEMSKELAARFLQRVKKRTPVGETGQLHNSWTVDPEVVHVGNCYEITVYNSVLYASFVEYGHRTPDHKRWVEGKFMMTISANQMEKHIPAIIQKKLEEHLIKVLNG